MEKRKKAMYYLDEEGNKIRLTIIAKQYRKKCKVLTTKNKEGNMLASVKARIKKEKCKIT